MGMIKKTEQKESGTDAALERLSAPKELAAASGTGGISSTSIPLPGEIQPRGRDMHDQYYKPPKQRDFDAEARGKTRCALYGQALASPGLAGLKFKNTKEFLAFVREAADDGVKYTFGE